MTRISAFAFLPGAMFRAAGVRLPRTVMALLLLGVLTAASPLPPSAHPRLVAARPRSPILALHTGRPTKLRRPVIRLPMRQPSVAESSLSVPLRLAMSALSRPRPILITHGDRAQPLIALTFDACQTLHQPAGYDAALIQVLRSTHTPATLFLGGYWMQTHPHQTQALATTPFFELGNHSWSHPDFTQLRPSMVRAEIAQTQTEAYQLTGRYPTLFRFPGGHSTLTVRAVVAALGLRMIQWDVVTADPSRRVSAQQIIQVILTHARNGSIIVMHMNGRGWHTAAALPTVIRELRARGYTLVTVSQLLGLAPLAPAVQSTVDSAEKRIGGTGGW
jgi:peptidoglycan-N-acetylglucosamine deacetylase